MAQKSATYPNSFGAFLSQTAAPNNPGALKGNHYAQMRAKSARHLSQNWFGPFVQDSRQAPIIIGQGN